MKFYISVMKFDTGYRIEFAILPSIDLVFDNKCITSIYIQWLVFCYEWHKYWKSGDDIEILVSRGKDGKIDNVFTNNKD